MLDYDDARNIWDYSEETQRLAEMYERHRKSYGEAKAYLDVQLARSYKAEIVERKMSYEKALLHLVAENEECKANYEIMLNEEQNYKGLEKVIEIRQSRVSLAQSLIKLTPRG